MDALLRLGVKIPTLQELGLVQVVQEPNPPQQPGQLLQLLSPPSPLSSEATSPIFPQLNERGTFSFDSPVKPEKPVRPLVTPPPSAPINLWGDQKPQMTWAELVAKVIEDLGGKATLQDIYKHVLRCFPYYRGTQCKKSTWQSAIRSNLSHYKQFVLDGKFWTVQSPSQNRLKPVSNDLWRDLEAIPVQKALPVTSSSASATALRDQMQLWSPFSLFIC